MKTRSILPAVAALIAIASGCNKTEEKKEEPKIPIRISTSVTKVSDNDFESGDTASRSSVAVTKTAATRAA